MTTSDEIKALRLAFDVFTQAIMRWETTVEVRLAEGSKNFDAHDKALEVLSTNLVKLDGKVDTLRLSDRKAIIQATVFGAIAGSGLGITSAYLTKIVLGGG